MMRVSRACTCCSCAWKHLSIPDCGSGECGALAAREAPELAIEVDSAGTAAYHAGSPPDARTVAAALRRGYALSHLRARVVETGDFSRFQLILRWTARTWRCAPARPGCRPGAPAPVLWTSPRTRNAARCPIRTTAERTASRTCWISWKRPRGDCWHTCASNPARPSRQGSFRTAGAGVLGRGRRPHHVGLGLATRGCRSRRGLKVRQRQR